MWVHMSYVQIKKECKTKHLFMFTLETVDFNKRKFTRFTENSLLCNCFPKKLTLLVFVMTLFPQRVTKFGPLRKAEALTPS